MTRLRRSLLFVPGNIEKMIQKARGLTEADAIVLDLEDAVPPGEKDRAREMVAQALKEPWVQEIGVRINAVDTSWWLEDIRAVIPARPAFLIVPKCEDPNHIILLEGAVRALAPDGPLPELIVTPETARGIFAAPQLVTASPLVTGMAFGGGDLVRDAGGEHTPDLDGLDYPRLHVVLAAASAKVAAYDVAYFMDLDNLAAVEAQSVRARRMGFQGKIVIHPKHLPTVNRVFSPSAEVIAEAREIVAAFEEAGSSGRGAIRFRGRMLDAPMLAQAQRTITMAQEIERRFGGAK